MKTASMVSQGGDGQSEISGDQLAIFTDMNVDKLN